MPVPHRDTGLIAEDSGSTGACCVSAPPPEAEILLRLVRLHFGMSALLLAFDEVALPRVVTRAGVAQDGLPSYLLTRIRREFETPGTRFLTSHPANRWTDADGAGEPLHSVEWPGSFIACAIPDVGGATVGALCLLEETAQATAASGLSDAQRTFLGESVALAAGLLRRTDTEAALQVRVSGLETGQALTTLALTGSGTGVWDRDVLSGEIHYSPAWKAILGYEAHELSTRIEDAYDRLHPDDRGHVQSTMQAHFDNRTDHYAVEHRIRCKDGRYIWICSRGKVISRDAAGRALRMVGTTTDITALREMAERLQRTNALVTNLTDEVPGLVFQYEQSADGNGRFTYTSDGIRDIYEVTPTAVAHDTRAVDARIDPRDLESYRVSLRESAEKLTPWRLEYRVMLPRQGMRWRLGEARPRRMADGGTVWHGLITDSTARKQIEAELHELATIDHLTQLSNRRHFMMQGETELLRARRGDKRFAAVIAFDLDHFKSVNDRWGHAAGDRALRHFADTLRASATEKYLLGRLGGEEFAAILPSGDIEAAVDFARRVQRRAADSPLLHGADRIPLAVSIGIDVMREDDVGAYQSLDRADRALYLAKARGRNRIELFHA